jgi:hypothetical protein
MYAARMARADLVRPVQALARFMTKWTRQQDLELHKLVCYIHTTKSWKTVGWIGDDIKDISTVIYSDADWAGSIDKFSTSGSFCCLQGKNTFFPLAARSKRQSTISSSTTEAELGLSSIFAETRSTHSGAVEYVKAHGGDTCKFQRRRNHPMFIFTEFWFIWVFCGFYWFFLVLHTESNFGKNPAEIWPGNPGRVLSASQAPRFILGSSTPQTPSETCHTLSFTASGCGVTVIVFLAHCS